jgi:hypothetical protein
MFVQELLTNRPHKRAEREKLLAELFHSQVQLTALEWAEKNADKFIVLVHESREQTNTPEVRWAVRHTDSCDVVSIGRAWQSGQIAMLKLRIACLEHQWSALE